MKDFLGCKKKTLRIWGTKTKTKHLQEYKNLAERFQGVERTALRTKKVWRHPSQWAGWNYLPFLRGNSKKRGGRIWARKLGCYAVLSRPSLKNCGRNYSILRDREFAQTRQQLEAKERELRAQVIEAKKCLMLSVKQTKNSCEIQVTSVNILLKL